MNAPVPLSALANVSLEDKYTASRGRVYMTAVQALARLPMLQRERDLAAGLNTAGFISGYRGSPLGGVDEALWRAKKHLASHHIKFQPGINEDLAAASVWGTQQVSLHPAKYDGVFAMWYGKAPGVDRSMDVIKHANSAGSAPHGGVLMIVGDDHACKSSTLANASDLILADAMVPVLFPSNVQEYLEFGLHGWALSRFSGLWVSMKCITETVECAASVTLDPDRFQPKIPTDYSPPPGGLHIRWPDPPMEMEARLLNQKLPAALAYARANRLDRIVTDSAEARLGIVASGKAYLDVEQAFELLGIDRESAARLGLRLYKVGMVWPLEPQGATAFAQGLDEILVVEEKRSLVETQLKELLYNSTGARPRIVGKFTEQGPADRPEGSWLLSAQGDLTPATVASALMARLQRLHGAETLAPYMARLAGKQTKRGVLRVVAERRPYFCSGCPHNSSTKVPDGSRALAGIGCHAMSTWMDRSTETHTQMGGEGAPWIGQAPFTQDKHIFANLGDGTYFHSGYMAIRAAVAAKVPITYKILFNDAVAMTGGQPIDGELSVPQITRQLAAEGVKRIVVVSDEPEKYRAVRDLAEGVTVHHRRALMDVQKELRDYPLVSALVYDQTCAAEKRRRRKRGTFPDPVKRAVINELVCEGCGDCSSQSNCLSIEPLETAFGRKRTINQSSCNKDFSCVEGFCPSFVTVHGTQLRKPAPLAIGGTFDAIPLPQIPLIDRPYDVIVTGIGGTGVITIGALIGMAAHLEGRGVSVMDMTGLAQKGGAVTSHVRVARAPEDIHAARVVKADLVLGCDLLVASTNDMLSRLGADRTRVLINTANVPTADFIRNPDWSFPARSAEGDILSAIGGIGAKENAVFLDIRELSVSLLGDAIYTNPFMLGYSWQKGWLPLSLEALESAIRLNAVSVDANLAAFGWGRRAAHDLGSVVGALNGASGRQPSPAVDDLDQLIEKHTEFLEAYQNAAYAERYRALVRKAQRAEETATGTDTLSKAIARSYFKLLAYKDEYEVARLHTQTRFLDGLKKQFEDGYSLRFHFAPPTLSLFNKGAIPRKREFGPWMLPALKVLARLRILRGTAFDPFGHTAERRMERELIREFEDTTAVLLDGLSRDKLELATEIASIPDGIRGYGHIKERNAATARKKWTETLTRYRKSPQEDQEASLLTQAAA